MPDLARTADIVFRRARVAVFVDGCFWHGCPQHFVAPRTNANYWGPKIERNHQRDLVVNRTLTAAGWTVLRVWEHEDVAAAASNLAAIVRERIAREEGSPPSHEV